MSDRCHDFSSIILVCFHFCFSFVLSSSSRLSFPIIMITTYPTYLVLCCSPVMRFMFLCILFVSKTTSQRGGSKGEGEYGVVPFEPAPVLVYYYLFAPRG
uniref:Uncharacterized protein n=1 Tax=Lotharella oceanica TaxID=641309 RepID=A0A7S2TS45_9EUKA